MICGSLLVCWRTTTVQRLIHVKREQHVDRCTYNWYKCWSVNCFLRSSVLFQTDWLFSSVLSASVPWTFCHSSSSLNLLSLFCFCRNWCPIMRVENFKESKMNRILLEELGRPVHKTFRMSNRKRSLNFLNIYFINFVVVVAKYECYGIDVWCHSVVSGMGCSDPFWPLSFMWSRRLDLPCLDAMFRSALLGYTSILIESVIITLV